MTPELPNHPRTDEIAADYRELLECGYIEKWRLHNLPAHECVPWWSALEQLATSDGLQVQRGGNNLGGGEFVLPCLSIVQPDGEEYVVPGTRTAEAARIEILRRMRDDWGETLAAARSRHGIATSG